MENVTLTVAECSEFHSLGYYKEIQTAKEAATLHQKFMKITPDFFPGIGIKVETKEFGELELDFISGSNADLDIISYVPQIKNNPKAIELIKETVNLLPCLKVIGSV